MIYTIVLVFHVVVCVLLIVVVLMQASRGGGLAGAFGGGGGDQTLFGGHETATFLSKATTYLAVFFMVLSVILAFLAANRRANRPDSVLRRSAQSQTDVIPAGESIEDVLQGAASDSVPSDSQ